MIQFIRTDSANTDFIQLVAALDADLRIRDGEEHAFYAQFNKIDTIKHVIVAYENSIAIGCGAIKPFAPDCMEVKRMFVLPEHRGKHIATAILEQLENWAVELKNSTCILETGTRQPEAIALYTKCGYERMDNYGQYAGVVNSVCFSKRLI